MASIDQFYPVANRGAEHLGYITPEDLDEHAHAIGHSLMLGIEHWRIVINAYSLSSNHSQQYGSVTLPADGEDIAQLAELTAPDDVDGVDRLNADTLDEKATTTGFPELPAATSELLHDYLYKLKGSSDE